MVRRHLDNLPNSPETRKRRDNAKIWIFILTCNQYTTNVSWRNLCALEPKFAARKSVRSVARCWPPPANPLFNGSSVFGCGSKDLSTEAIAQAVGLSVSHVRRVWSEYLRGGLAAGQGRPKGGRRHQNLTLAQERAVLVPLRQEAQAGKLVTARSIKAHYQNTLGRAVPDSTVCRLLARHQWRRVQPRPKHPKDNPAVPSRF